nr:transcription factor bHLH122-like [Ipomoea batatas]
MPKCCRKHHLHLSKAFKNRRVGVDLSPNIPLPPSSRQWFSISETRTQCLKEKPISCLDDFLKVTDEKPSLNAQSTRFLRTQKVRFPSCPLYSHQPQFTQKLCRVSSFCRDSVPCRVRPKRGCRYLTQLRSIAERVRLFAIAFTVNFPFE